VLYPIGVKIFETREHVPPDFDKWTRPNKRTWNDYSTTTIIFPSQVAEVDFR
jgi:hypothetical protein